MQRGDRAGAIGALSGIRIVADFERELLSAGKLIDATAGGAHVISGGVYEVATWRKMDRISAVLARARRRGGLLNKKACAVSPENPATMSREYGTEISQI